MLTIDAERAYQRKLMNLGQRYDTLKEKYSALLCGERPPVKIAELLGGMLFHIGSAIRYYKEMVELPHYSEAQKKLAKEQLSSARDCRDVLTWLTELSKGEKQ